MKPHFALPLRHKTQGIVKNLLDWYAASARDLPWRRTHDAYAIWVSEIMLQQTQVKTVIPYWERWLKEFPTIQSVAKAPRERLEKAWEGLGYYRRVRNLKQAAEQILEKHDGRFPERFEEVLDLPGVGRYTAGAICSIAFDQPTPLLDGNVIRVLTRLYGIADNPKATATNQRLWELAGALVKQASTFGEPPATQKTSPADDRNPGKSNRYCSSLNQALMELGALVCTAQNPRCLICPTKSLCEAFRQKRTAEWPNLGKRQKVTQHEWLAFVVERQGRFLVRQRPEGVVNAGLWEFPNLEIKDQAKETKALACECLGVIPVALEKGPVIKHSITRYRISLNAYWVQIRGEAKVARGAWKTAEQLKELVFPAAHKKLATLATHRILAGR